jgi:uncharacterized protein YqgC (DUF456 family)
MDSLDFLSRIFLETLTLFALLVGLGGLFIPIFPGLTVMWLATLIYAVVQAVSEQMATIDWVLFAIITLLMIAGNILDNVLIAKNVRDKQVPWKSIILGFLAGIIASIFFTPLIGIIAAPLGLFAAEYTRLKERKLALESTKAWMTGWGMSLAARIAIGVVMVGLWMAWAWM